MRENAGGWLRAMKKKKKAMEGCVRKGFSKIIIIII